ncbi:MAG TPA: RNA helicase, partial [Deferrimonas sp.]
SFADEDLVFHLPDIEEYIGQKIPSAFPEDDDFCWDYKRSPPRKRAPIPEKFGAGGRKPAARRGPPRRKP